MLLRQNVASKDQQVWDVFKRPNDCYWFNILSMSLSWPLNGPQWYNPELYVLFPFQNGRPYEWRDSVPDTNSIPRQHLVLESPSQKNDFNLGQRLIMQKEHHFRYFRSISALIANYEDVNEEWEVNTCFHKNCMNDDYTSVFKKTWHSAYLLYIFKNEFSTKSMDAGEYNFPVYFWYQFSHVHDLSRSWISWLNRDHLAHTTSKAVLFS